MGEVEEEIGRALASPFRVKNQKLKPIFLQAERGEKQTNEFTNNYLVNFDTGTVHKGSKIYCVNLHL